jgi:pyroglutamyl-peptidase
MKCAILTGFEPFGDYPANPTEDLARQLDRDCLNGVEISGIVLPCAYYRGFDVLYDEIMRINPEIILSMGLSSSVPAVRLEMVARNRMQSKYRDVDERSPDNEPIVPGGDEFIQLNSDGSELANRVGESGMFLQRSVYADAFICNSLMYLTAKFIDRYDLDIKQAFIHIPWTNDYCGSVDIADDKVTIAEEEVKKTIEVLLEAMS